MLLDARIIFILLTFQGCSILSSLSLIVRVFLRKVLFATRYVFCFSTAIYRFAASALCLDIFLRLHSPRFPAFQYVTSSVILVQHLSTNRRFLFSLLSFIFICYTCFSCLRLGLTIILIHFAVTVSFLFTATPIIFHLQRSFFVLRILLRSIFFLYSYEIYSHFFYLVSDFNFNFLL